MKEVIKLFKQIQETSSTNDKKSIITANKDNELFKRCLRFLLDTNITTGIADSKLRKVNENTLAQYATVKFNNFEELLEYLEVNNTGRDEDIANVKGFIYDPDRYIPDGEFFFYVQMITKKYRLGADKKVVNSCIPGLIPSWDIQQAYPLSEKNEPKDGEWFSLSQKLNGNNNGLLDGKNISRQGKEFKGLDHIIDDINKLSFKDMFFNGELIRKNTDNLPDDENFQIGTGIINSDDMNKTCIKFVIYEMFPKEEFLKGESKLTYKQRRK